MGFPAAYFNITLCISTNQCQEEKQKYQAGLKVVQYLHRKISD
jgi:hypothetical protein